MDSDNPIGAENQQERLISADWVVSFVDGEGCFSIGFVDSLIGLGGVAIGAASRCSTGLW